MAYDISFYVMMCACTCVCVGGVPCSIKFHRGLAWRTVPHWWGHDYQRWYSL